MGLCFFGRIRLRRKEGVTSRKEGVTRITKSKRGRARGIDTPATGDGGASGRGGSRFWPRSAAPLGKAALAARRRRIFFHYWAVQNSPSPFRKQGGRNVMPQTASCNHLARALCFLCSLALSLLCWPLSAQAAELVSSQHCCCAFGK